MSSTAPSRPTAKRSKPRSKPRAAPRVALQKPHDEKIAQLREAHRRGKVVLFVGAGISMGLGLPPWSALIEHMARELGIDARSFGDKGGYLTLAEYFRLRHGSIGPLRSWMDREWHRGDVRVEASRIHELLAKGRFPIIYTTTTTGGWRPRSSTTRSGTQRS
ncbi:MULTISPECIES: hypothetical protein [Variovorax]|uniref:hypothetical protein n=1 Tax=Variovorax TaxID=34072 RepID=UPI0028584B30|nr:hypothetical protein [Variovorax sp. 3319]MDR6888073.1 hypothetical protein [Variovorax sp. 3319]